jgi:hypothetical protein
MNQTGFTKEIKTEQDVKELLTHIKGLIKKNNYLFLNRPKNKQTMLTLGVLPATVREIIFDLEASDYCSGPQEDNDFPDKQVAVFGYDFRGTELYIKFSFGTDGLPVVVVSFHEPEYLMKYPF